jgi:urate oxidase / 2-oxo-4-hydroxy-4-carboxy-5-ureidoimidazoline decarboxylase
MSSQDRMMYYGKADVFVYRTYAKPFINVTSIPESSFAGRDNVIFGMNVQVSLKGDFLSTFTEGDNHLLVATDSMKNFIHRHAAKYDGTTMDGFLEFVCQCFLDTYPQISSVEMTGEEIVFEPVFVPGEQGFCESGLVYRRSRNEFAKATVEMGRGKIGNAVIKYRSGMSDLQLIKVSGSSFAGFVRDEYTTLPEAHDRPLFIYLTIDWGYTNVADVLGTDESCYVPPEQVQDIARTVFHELHNHSIQHLIYHIGCRILQRFPQLADVRFETNNRTWDSVVEEIPGSRGKVYTEPRPPYGFQGFVVTREDLAKEKAKSNPMYIESV